MEYKKQGDGNIFFLYQFEPVQMVEGLSKVAIDALPDHRWVEVLTGEEKL